MLIEAIVSQIAERMAICESYRGLVSEEKNASGVNDRLDHHSESQSRPESGSPKHPVALNRKPGDSEKTANSISYSAAEIKQRIRKFRNGGFPINIGTISSTLITLGRVLMMRYEGGSRYATYETGAGKITFRLGDHNAVGKNFANKSPGRSRYVSVYIEKGSHPDRPTPVTYTEVCYPLSIFQNHPQEVLDSIINGVDGMLDTGEFNVNPSLAAKRVHKPSA